jgi:two-component system alkaline phosphatase synthesis response regulator PhoP
MNRTRLPQGDTSTHIVRGEPTMSKTRILVVEDEEDIAELIQFTLTREGFICDHEPDGANAVRAAQDLRPDLVLLDLMLPGSDGNTICKALRAHPDLGQTPVIMLTARGQESDMVRGLEHGADDYITKPFSPRLLCARIRAVLRRRGGAAPDTDDSPRVIRRGPIEIFPGKHQVRLSGDTLELTYTEFALLNLLAGRPGWVFTRYQIVDAVRGEGYPVTERAVDVQVVGLRRKLGEAAAWIETVRGVGYRFRESDN